MTDGRRPIVLLHGYSSNVEGLWPWRDALGELGYKTADIHLAEYVSLSNEITIKDIAEGFDRALNAHDLLENADFDAIVHSTGALVIREWLVTYNRRRARLKHLIALAPANFGSPMAHRGRGFIGAVHKGRKAKPPDFFEAGKRVLSGLELGSAYTWDLAHRDLLGPEESDGGIVEGTSVAPVYGPGVDTPFPFVFIGRDKYPFLGLIDGDEGGYDGTVRWAGASLSTRKLVIDMTVAPEHERVRAPSRRSIPVPMVLVDGVHHSGIMRRPDVLIEMVREAIEVTDRAGYERWSKEYSSLDEERLKTLGGDQWQQFVVRVVDERGDPVPDYYIEVRVEVDGELKEMTGFTPDVHAYTDDPSFRCFHVNVSELRGQMTAKARLQLSLTASAGSHLIAYHGIGSERTSLRRDDPDDPAIWDAQLDLTEYLTAAGVSFFYPFTTTLVEVRVNREPMPPLPAANQIARFVVTEQAG